MNIVEALDLVEQGYKVRLPGWIAGSYVGKVPPTEITSNVGPRANVNSDESKFGFIGYENNTIYKILKRALPGAYTFVLPGNNNLPRPFKNKKTVV